MAKKPRSKPDAKTEAPPPEMDHAPARVMPLRGSIIHATGATATVAVALGAFALGAVAVGALAIGSLAIGRLGVGRARFKRLEIDELVIRRRERRD